MDHVELINRIIEAEQQAQQMSEEAREKQQHLQEDLRQNAAEMRKGYLAQAQTRVGLVREREEKVTEEKLAALEALSVAETEAMQTLFRDHRKEWADTIFRMIIGKQ